MFERTALPQSWLLRRVAPSLSPSYVASSIVRAIEQGHTNTVLRLPMFTHSARLLSPVSNLVPRAILKLSHWVSSCLARTDNRPQAPTGQWQTTGHTRTQASDSP